MDAGGREASGFMFLLAPRAYNRPVIELTGVTLQRAGQPLFEDFSLSLPDAGLYLVSGPAGSGKSLLGQLMAGELRPQRGRVSIDGIDIYRPFVLNRPALRRIDSLDPVPGGVSISDYCHAQLFEAGGDYRAFSRHLALIEQALRVRGTDFTNELSSGQRAGLQIVLAGLLPLRCIILDGQFNLLDPASAEPCFGLFQELYSGNSSFVIALAQRCPPACGTALASLQLTGKLPVQLANDEQSTAPETPNSTPQPGKSILRLTLTAGRDPRRAYLSGRSYRVLGVLERGLRIEMLGKLSDVLEELLASGIELRSIEWEG
jgi:energy-coupling factor transporter ATP-binding protein EcfA2